MPGTLHGTLHKNVDFRETEGLSELSKLHIDAQDFVELRNLCNFAIPLAGGSVAGTAGRALAAVPLLPEVGVWQVVPWYRAVSLPDPHCLSWVWLPERMLIKNLTRRKSID